MQLNGKDWLSMVLSASNELDRRKEEINSLNIFPVPDGDTGVNMSLTLTGARSVSKADTLSECAEQIANKVLRSARGNSGAILSLFFRGFAKAVRGLNTADTDDIATAFAYGKAEAYKAVMNPTEGTILTVIRTCAEQAETSKTHFRGDMVGFFSLLSDVAADTVAKTPEMLPILKQAKVVDAGGCGFAAVLYGMKVALEGHPVEAQNIETASPATGNSADFGEFHSEDIKYGYCTECIVEKDLAHRGEGRASDFYRFVTGIGDSAVFLDDDEIIKLHVHTNHPGKVLETALKYGSLVTVKIENMRMQHSELSSGVFEDGAKESGTKKPVVTLPEKNYGYVAVCLGDGLRDVFLDLGVNRVVTGGQTMNPSTEDLVDAILATPAKTVFVFPNNKNIFMVATQAAKIVNDRQVVVIATTSVPEGVSALMAVNEELDVDALTEEFRRAVANVTVLSFTQAVRDTEIDGLSIHDGDVLGMVSGKIVASLPTYESCLDAVSRQTQLKLSGARFVSVFYGDRQSEETANGFAEQLRAFAPQAEFSVVRGGQPVYQLLISIE